MKNESIDISGLKSFINEEYFYMPCMSLYALLYIVLKIDYIEVTCY